MDIEHTQYKSSVWENLGISENRFIEIKSEMLKILESSGDGKSVSISSIITEIYSNVELDELERIATSYILGKSLERSKAFKNKI